MPEERTPPDTHCEYCGVEYSVVEERRPPERRPAVPTSAEEPPEVVARCEFCGAEYTPPEGNES